MNHALLPPVTTVESLSTPCFEAINGHQTLLLGLITLLESIDGNDYTDVLPEVYSASIGAHVRHCLDHYQSFFAALEGTTLDYSIRNRELSCEMLLSEGRTRLIAVTKNLAGLPSSREPLSMICTETGGLLSVTTITRELEFLASHTVHHCALIGVICRLKGLPLPDSFGIAPSTLRHNGLLN